MIHNAYLGEVVHVLRTGHTKRFRPRGQIHYLDSPKGKLYTAREAPPAREPSIATKIGGGGLSARIFVGLNVGTDTKYSLEQVMRETLTIRKKQGRKADGSFLGQYGIYEDNQGRVIEEPSVQIILIDVGGETEKTWTKEMTGLAKKLRERFEQESVILEIQKKGILVALYSITERKRKK